MIHFITGFQFSFWFILENNTVDFLYYSILLIANISLLLLVVEVVVLAAVVVVVFFCLHAFKYYFTHKGQFICHD